MWKRVLVAAFAAAVVIGLLFATGLVKISGSSPEHAGDDGDDDPKGEAGTSEPEDDDEIDELKSLGYVGATPIRAEDAGKSGVIKYEEGKAAPGKNLVIPCGWGRDARKAGLKNPIREARLVDMDGTVLHTWTHDYPGRGNRGWANAKIGPKGDLYVVHARTGLLRLDWESNLVWGRDEYYHHDLDFLPDGTVVALVEEMRTVEFEDSRHHINDNGLAFISPDGKLKRVLWLWDVIHEEPWFIERFQGRLKDARKKKKLKFTDVDPSTELGHKGKRGGLDIMHTNTVELVESKSEGRWEPGDLLLSFRYPDVIAVVDPKKEKVRWHWGENLDDQHDPSILESGNILLFDNGKHRKRSRVIEIDPETGKIVWKFERVDDRWLFSEVRGLAERLDNDNVLVVESQEGHVVEVQRDGSVVWEYFGTDVVGDMRIALRLHRLQGTELGLVDHQLKR